MGNAPAVLFLQKRSHRAGAQTSLARILGSRILADLRPVALLGTTGWLADELSRREIDHVVTPFPSPRALSSRVWGLGAFARSACGELSKRAIRPACVVANDHQECPLALAIAKKLGNLPVIALLRSVGMGEGDFRKYNCAECEALLCVGEALLERVRLWTDQVLELLEEGFSNEEFHPMQEAPAHFPARILVVGNEDPGKGFTDFIEALDWIETHYPAFPQVHCDFTGLEPRGSSAVLARNRRATFSFLGRLDDYSSRVREYALAVHPSRAETFGMAPIEALLAGTPTLLSATGAGRKLDLLEPWRFAPADVSSLAGKLVEVWKTWPKCCLSLPEIQQSLRETFHIDRTAEPIRAALAKCGI